LLPHLGHDRFFSALSKSSLFNYSLSTITGSVVK